MHVYDCCSAEYSLQVAQEPLRAEMAQWELPYAGEAPNGAPSVYFISSWAKKVRSAIYTHIHIHIHTSHTHHKSILHQQIDFSARD